MRFRFILVAAILFGGALALSSCASEADKAEIVRLKNENALLNHQVDSLQMKLDSLTAYGDSVKKSLEKLDMGI